MLEEHWTAISRIHRQLGSQICKLRFDDLANGHEGEADGLFDQRLLHRRGERERQGVKKGLQSP